MRGVSLSHSDMKRLVGVRMYNAPRSETLTEVTGSETVKVSKGLSLTGRDSLHRVTIDFDDALAMKLKLAEQSNKTAPPSSSFPEDTSKSSPV